MSIVEERLVAFFPGIAGSWKYVEAVLLKATSISLTHAFALTLFNVLDCCRNYSPRLRARTNSPT